MRRVLPFMLTAALVVGVAVTTTTTQPAAAASEAVVQPRTDVHSCDARSTRVSTYAKTDLEAQYNEDLVLCDWGPQQPGHYRFTFTNKSPVVWAFKDRVETWLVPANNAIFHEQTGVAPLFSKFAIASHLSHSEWIVVPEEQVAIASLDTLAWGVATPMIISSWLLYKQQAEKIKKLGTAYAKRIATTGYASRTRTFLWNCVAAGVTTNNAVKSDGNANSLDFAATWLATAKKGSDCVESFHDLFSKKSSKLPSVTYSMEKWFNRKALTPASEIVGEIKVSRAWMSSIIGLFRAIK
ncbi:MAG: hypothetical protein JWL61_2883 [Gemmatimonadetes bacterium]|nr:hypothetical protein [Gemmatimonadota bacterium]